MYHKANMEQLAFNLRYELEQVTDDPTLLQFATLIDQKIYQGMKCDDLKEQLIALVQKRQISFNVEIIKNYF